MRIQEQKQTLQRWAPNLPGRRAHLQIPLEIGACICGADACWWEACRCCGPSWGRSCCRIAAALRKGGFLAVAVWARVAVVLSVLALVRGCGRGGGRWFPSCAPCPGRAVGKEGSSAAWGLPWVKPVGSTGSVSVRFLAAAVWPLATTSLPSHLGFAAPSWGPASRPTSVLLQFFSMPAVPPWWSPACRALIRGRREMVIVTRCAKRPLAWWGGSFSKASRKISYFNNYISNFSKTHPHSQYPHTSHRKRTFSCLMARLKRIYYRFR